MKLVAKGFHFFHFHHMLGKVMNPPPLCSPVVKFHCRLQNEGLVEEVTRLNAISKHLASVLLLRYFPILSFMYLLPICLFSCSIIIMFRHIKTDGSFWCLSKIPRDMSGYTVCFQNLLLFHTCSFSLLLKNTSASFIRMVSA